MFGKNTIVNGKTEDSPNEGTEETPEETPRETPTILTEDGGEKNPGDVKPKLHANKTTKERRLERIRNRRSK